MKFDTLRRRAALAVIAWALAGCGGGGGSNDLFVIDDPYSISGMAARGRPLVGASVVVKDRTGRRFQTTTDDRGFYAVTAPITQPPSWPLVARVSGGTLGCGTRSPCTPSANSETYVGISVGGPRISTSMNLTPMSHAVTSAATHRDANAVFDAPDLLDPVNPLDLIDATFTLLDWLLRLDPTLLLPRDIDFVGGLFVPVPGDPQDAVLDTMASVLAAVFIDTPAFNLLVTTSATSTTPATPIYCDVAGLYQGTYDGSTSGSWQAEVDASTGLVGNVQLDGGSSGIGAATRIGTGAQRANASWTVATLTRFSGTITANAAIAGHWTHPLGTSGAFAGQRVRKASGCP